MGKLMLPTNSGTGDFKPVSAGTHIGVCDMVVDLGLQEGSGAYPKTRRQVLIRFQLPHDRVKWDKDGKHFNQPAVISQTYTASMHAKSTLRHTLESWRGRQFTEKEAADFDVASILGKPCMVVVMQSESNGKVYANISGIGGLPAGISAQTIIPETLPIFYSSDDPATYHQLPEWIRKKVDEQIIEEPRPPAPPPPSQGGPSAWDGADYDAMAATTQITDDDIPF
jgi:hypothetical protein